MTMDRAQIEMSVWRFSFGMRKMVFDPGAMDTHGVLLLWLSDTKEDARRWVPNAEDTDRRRVPNALASVRARAPCALRVVRHRVPNSAHAERPCLPNGFSLFDITCVVTALCLGGSSRDR